MASYKKKDGDGKKNCQITRYRQTNLMVYTRSKTGVVCHAIF